MAVIAIESLDDPRLAPYRQLKERELARQGGRFIAEGHFVVQRLLDSDFPTESVLISTRRVKEMAPQVPADVPLYVATDELIRQTLGFKFHSGVIACGVRKPNTSLSDITPPAGGDALLVICPDTNNTENLGALIRLCAGFGVTAMVLGPQCCDPFFRQSIRVSMGTVFRLPIYRSTDLVGDLRRLREQEGFELAATVLDASAEPLSGASRMARLGLLLGHEAQGLSAEHIALCQRRLTIPMKLGTDSLNVAVAAGVFLYHFTQERAIRR